MTTPDLSQRFRDVEERFGSIEAQLSDPSLASDPGKLRQLSKSHSDLAQVVAKIREYHDVESRLEQARSLANDPDPDMAEMARLELEELEGIHETLMKDIQFLLVPRDPLDEKNIIIEIRAGTGGDEAALFAFDLFRMYNYYCEKKGWKTELLSSNETGLNGFKEVIFSVTGERVYSRMKFEAGTHRVQRVPTTEAQGRIHTSAATVAVLPEAEEVDVVIKPDDLRIDVFRSGGPGGQSVNTTDSAVRITHIPTGTVVSCQDEKSQHKNKAKALKVLRSRILEVEMQKQHAEQAATRKGMVGSGDRSERIRTYNFPQNRLTDHRINLTLYSLDRIMEGDLNPVIEPLILEEQTEKLKNI
ncbi:MAG: peptide chain release factor 1 [Candidatus Sumerlaeaceae bacterium]